MKFLRSLLPITVVIIIGLIVGCSKGSTGPAGPTGPAGAAGPDSVFSSPWFNLAFTYDAPDTVFVDTIAAASITKPILDSGIILTYVNTPDNAGNYHVVSVASLNFVFYEDYSIGKINLVSYQGDLSGIPYRYVTIPGNLVKTNSAGQKIVKGYTPSELRSMSYNQVQQVLSNKN